MTNEYFPRKDNVINVNQILFFNSILFIYLFLYLFSFEKQWDKAWAGEGQRQEETQNLKQTPGFEKAVSTEPDAGLEPMNCEIMTWAEVGRSTNWATQAPL